MAEALIPERQSDEEGNIRSLVQTVIDQVSGGLWASAPSPIDGEDWSAAWLAVVEAAGRRRDSRPWL